jgi:putative transposase
VPLRLMCDLLDVSPAGFYASLTRRASKRSQSNARLTLEIRAVHEASRARYGAPKVYHELKAQGISCGHNRVSTLMRKSGLRSKRPRSFRITTESNHHRLVAENYLDRRFDISLHSELNQAWVADITYLPTREGWLYLAAIVDLASRRLIGWHADSTLEHDVAVRALEMALKTRGALSSAIIHHSDRGVQYASEEYQVVLKAAGIQSSMSRRGDCWDNAPAESFFATLKTELVQGAKWESRSQAKREVAEFIDWYNHNRRHQTLGYLPPAEYEIQMLKRKSAA